VGPPGLGDVGLDGAAGRAVVVKAGDGAINFEGGQVEEAALERVGDGRPESFGRGGGGAAGDGLVGGLGGLGGELEVLQARDLGVDGGLKNGNRGRGEVEEKKGGERGRGPGGREAT
jgi:hypothetical protein